MNMNRDAMDAARADTERTRDDELPEDSLVQAQPGPLAGALCTAQRRGTCDCQETSQRVRHTAVDLDPVVDRGASSIA